jgi:hypothetical protein
VRIVVACATICIIAPVHALPRSVYVDPPADTAAEQLVSDSYTRYELLEPASGKFRILYEVSATEPGATAYFNPIRKGSRASDERVTDLATGQPLKFAIVSGEAARKAGFPQADVDGEYVQVTLARSVPVVGGEGRILIDKTYEDRKSYYQQGDLIVFERPLGIDRNAIVLPAGYSLVSCNLPAQVLQELDGRTKISFWDTSPAQAPLIIKARRVAVAGSGKSSVPTERLQERASQTREIVYLLQQPETHRFELYHDYTEKRAGTSTYVNVVRAGSTVSNPSGVILDTGRPLAARIVRGAKVAELAANDPAASSNSEAVVFSFLPVPTGGSTRLRLQETYTDPGSYRLLADELVWERRLGRAANAVVLPQGWILTNSSAPVITSELKDGRTRLDYLNPRTDELDVVITARRAKKSGR